MRKSVLKGILKKQKTNFKSSQNDFKTANENQSSAPDDFAPDHRHHGLRVQNVGLRHGHQIPVEYGEIRNLADLDRAQPVPLTGNHRAGGQEVVCDAQRAPHVATAMTARITVLRALREQY